jgi:hypothetical protein
MYSDAVQKRQSLLGQPHQGTYLAWLTHGSVAQQRSSRTSRRALVQPPTRLLETPWETATCFARTNRSQVRFDAAIPKTMFWKTVQEHTHEYLRYRAKSAQLQTKFKSALELGVTHTCSPTAIYIKKKLPIRNSYRHILQPLTFLGSRWQRTAILALGH